MNASGGWAQTGILVALGVVVVAGIIGVKGSPDNAVLILGFCSVITAQLLNLLQQAHTASKVAEVKDTLAVTTTQAASERGEILAVSKEGLEVGKKAEALGNSAMLGQKRLVAVSARGKAETSKDPADIALAEQAEEVYQEHKRQQEKMDAEAATAKIIKIRETDLKADIAKVPEKTAAKVVEKLQE